MKKKYVVPNNIIKFIVTKTKFISSKTKFDEYLFLVSRKIVFGSFQNLFLKPKNEKAYTLG